MSMTAPSLRTSMSLSAVRKIRLRVAAVAAGCDQASSRSAPSCISCWRSRSPSGRGLPRDDSSDLAFYYVHGLQCLVPAAPKLAGHQAIRGIDSVVLPTGMRGLVTRLLKRQLLDTVWGSHRLDVGRPDYLAPLLGLVGDELAE